MESLDSAKLNSIVEVMQYSFEEIEEMLEDLKERADEIDCVVDSTPLVQLLVAVKKVCSQRAPLPLSLSTSLSLSPSPHSSSDFF